MEKYIIDLTADEVLILKDLVSNIKISASEEPEQFCETAKELSQQIPARIREHLREFSKIGSKTGFLLLRGAPVHFHSLTPANNNEKIGETVELAHIQAVLLECVGELIAYEAEGYGQLFQDVVPIQAMAKNQTSVGSNAELEIHTEQAFSTLRPDILSLACIRGDPNALTYILPVHEVLNKMTPDEKQLLREPLWKTGVDLSFKLHGEEFIEGDVRGPMPIVYGHKEDPCFRFDQDLMFSESEIGDHLLKKIVRIYYEKKFQHNLTPGEIILIDNRRAVHGRSPFYPKYDGKDRFLVRSFSVFDYDKSAYARKGRTVSAIYS